MRFFVKKRFVTEKSQLNSEEKCTETCIIVRLGIPRVLEIERKQCRLQCTQS